MKQKLFQKKFMKNSGFTHKETQEFLELLAELLGNGFSLEKSFVFLKTVTPNKKTEIKEMNRQLLKGKNLSLVLSSLKLSESQQAQLSFAEVHGDLVGTLTRLSQQMLDKEKQKQHLNKIISYPMLLLLFLSGMILGMKLYILPQLEGFYEATEGRNIGIMFINNSPLIIGCILLAGGLMYVLLKYYLSKKSAVFRSNWLCQLPFVGRFFKTYYTSLFATEWGKLLTQGMEFREVVLVMKGPGYTPLMKEMAQTINQKLEKGIYIEGPIKEWYFLKPELNLILLQGEVKGDLGKELLIYGKKEWDNWLNLAERKMRFLQPLMFLLIAVLIISVYAALLLPIYSGMGEMY